MDAACHRVCVAAIVIVAETVGHLQMIAILPFVFHWMIVLATARAFTLVSVAATTGMEGMIAQTKRALTIVLVMVSFHSQVTMYLGATVKQAPVLVQLVTRVQTATPLMRLCITSAHSTVLVSAHVLSHILYAFVLKLILEPDVNCFIVLGTRILATQPVRVICTATVVGLVTTPTGTAIVKKVFVVPPVRSYCVEQTTMAFCAIREEAVTTAVGCVTATASSTEIAVSMFSAPLTLTGWNALCMEIVMKIRVSASVTMGFGVPIVRT
eukprot:Rmarinus@m.2405